MADRRITDIAGKFLQVKDWREFQHYHDRNPSWIKLHKKILDNPDFQRLPIASKALAPMLWLLASENMDGQIPWEPEDIAWRLRMTVKEFQDGLYPLLTKGFFVVVGNSEQDASAVLALMEHPAIPEKETETYKQEKEKEATSAFVLPEWVPKSNWFEFIRMRRKIRKDPTPHAMDLIVRELDKLRFSGQDPGQVLDQSTRNSWQDVYPLKEASNGKSDGWEAADKRVAARLGEKD